MQLEGCWVDGRSENARTAEVVEVADVVGKEKEEDPVCRDRHRHKESEAEEDGSDGQHNGANGWILEECISSDQHLVWSAAAGGEVGRQGNAGAFPFCT